MMTIHINTNPDGQVAYFLKSLSKDDYYFDGHAIPGRFHGKLREDFALPSKVSKKLFSTLAHGINPKTRKNLRSRKIKNARTSYEYCFTPSKSVSILGLLGDDQTRKDILNAHRFAVTTAMKHIEQDAYVQTRMNGRKTYVQTGKIVYSRFDHFTSRPVQNQDQDSDNKIFVSDMNIHSHCVVNAVSKLGDQYLALEASIIHANAPYYEAIYHSTLSNILQDKGFMIERTKDRFEIKSLGLTRRTIEKFSNRSALINKKAKKLGIIDPKLKGQLGSKTRVNKSTQRQDINLITHWNKRLTAIEKNAIKSARGGITKSALRITPEQSISRALETCLERQSTAPRKRVLAEALKLGYGKFTLTDVVKALNERKDILSAKNGYIDHITTKDYVQLEKRIVELCVNTRNTLPAINPTYNVQQTFLNDQQKSAIHKILNTTDQVCILSGVAGSGKTTILKELKFAVEQKGKSIIALAPSSVASRDVMRKEGLQSADTIASFLINKKVQAQARNQIILVDESGLVGTKTLSKILDVAKAQKAKVILSGDTAQHSSPEFGSPIRQIIEHRGLPVIRVNEILRQKHNPKYKQAVKMMSEGRTRLGFKILDKMGAIHEVSDISKRHEMIAQRYIDALNRKRSVMVVSPTHAECMMLNDQIRKAMKFDGRIKKSEKPYDVYKALTFTNAEKQDFAKYESGQVVQFFQNTKGFKAGLKYTVLGHDRSNNVIVSHPETHDKTALRFSEVEKFQVFTTHQIKLAKGDQIRLTQNGRSQDRKMSRVYNGQTYSIEGFNKAGDIKLSGGKSISKNFGHLNYSYATTSHSSQGKTTDEIIISQSAVSRSASNTKQFYVSCSRGRYAIDIYTDDKEELRKAIGRDGKQMHAVDLENLHKKRLYKARVLHYFNQFKLRIHDKQLSQQRQKNERELSRF